MRTDVPVRTAPPVGGAGHQIVEAARRCGPMALALRRLGRQPTSGAGCLRVADPPATSPDIQPGVPHPAYGLLRASMRKRVEWATNGPSASISSCRARSWSRYALDGEAGHHPDHLAQEVDDRPDVVELHAQRLRTQVDDLEPGGLRIGDRPARDARQHGPPRTADRGSTPRVRSTLAGPTCCEKYVPPGRSTRAISSHHDGHRMAAGDQVERRVGEGQRRRRQRPRRRPRRAGGAARWPSPRSAARTRWRPSAAAAAGTPASTSPPPVWMSRAADARASRSPSARA